VVIDFEYASPNMPGLEFANHFTEWCYDYHHPEHSWMCDTRQYPNDREQYRFVRSYVMHRPQFNPSASSTPKMEGREKTNISDFMLDARAPPSTSTPGPVVETDYDKEEREREKVQEREIQRLLRETRIWRPANTAQWVAWGIVQAKVPELYEMEKKNAGEGGGEAHPMSDPMNEEEKRLKEESERDRPEGRAQEESHREGDQGTIVTREDASNGGAEGDESGEEEQEDFDYLAYAQDRAMFFWGDCVQMGLVKLEELPEEMRKMIKIVPY
jgi:choline kinase